MAESLFTSQTPAVSGSDGAPGITTATSLKFAVDGTITHVRWYAGGPSTGGTWTGLVWEVTGDDGAGSGTGTLLASKAFVGTPTVDDWNLIELDSPISVDSAKLYRVGIHNDSRYVATNNFFNGTALTNGNITAPMNGDDPVGLGSLRQGSFIVSATTTAYPTQVGTAACYFVDVVFEVAGAPTVEIASGQTDTFTGSSTTAVARAAASAQTDTFTGSSTTAVARAAASAQTDTFTGSSSATVAPGAASSQTVAFAGSSAAMVVRNAQSTGGLSLAGSTVAEPDASAPAPRGNWGSLRSIYQANLTELDRARTEPIRDCPNHGWPLEPGRTGGTVHCVFGGEVFDLHGNPVLI